MILSQAGLTKKPPRDPQQDLVYEAETAAGAHDSRRFEDFTELAEWVRACLTTGLIEQDYPVVRTYVAAEGASPGQICIRERRYHKSKTGGATIAHANAFELAFTKKAWCTWMVIHELAHLVAARQFGGAAMGHSWQYCSVYLKLVGWFIGYKERDILKEEFDKRGIRYEQPPVAQWIGTMVGSA